MKLKREVQIGILFAVSLSLFYWSVNFLKGTNVFLGVQNYFVIYDNTNGLQVSHPVYVSGVNVGRVKRIELLQDYKDKILVMLEIKSQVLIPKGTTAKLEDASVLGGKKITLIPTFSNELLEDGDTLRAMIDKSISEFMEEKALPVLGHFDSTLYFFNKILKDFRDGGVNANEALKKTSVGLDKSIAFIDRVEKELIPSLVEARKAIKGFRQTREHLDSVLIYSKELTRGVRAEDVNTMLSNLNTTTEKLQSLLQKIETQGTIGKLIREDSLYNNLNTTVVSLDSLLRDLQRNPKRYVHFSLFGRKR